VEIILAIEEKIFKIQPLEIKPKIELVEEEVKIIEPKMGIELVVVVHVDIIKIIRKETCV
jgi:hypothetical protein